jgi:hypothetical protein
MPKSMFLVNGEDVRHSAEWLMRRLIKVGAKIVRHGGYVIFQLAEVAVPRALFDRILGLIAGLRPWVHPT